MVIQKELESELITHSEISAIESVTLSEGETGTAETEKENTDSMEAAVGEKVKSNFFMNLFQFFLTFNISFFLLFVGLLSVYFFIASLSFIIIIIFIIFIIFMFLIPYFCFYFSILLLFLFLFLIYHKAVLY